MISGELHFARHEKINTQRHRFSSCRALPCQLWCASLPLLFVFFLSSTIAQFRAWFRPTTEQSWFVRLSYGRRIDRLGIALYRILRRLPPGARNRPQGLRPSSIWNAEMDHASWRDLSARPEPSVSSLGDDFPMLSCTLPCRHHFGRQHYSKLCRFSGLYPGLGDSIHHKDTKGTKKHDGRFCRAPLHVFFVPFVSLW